jgi:hypothetical protein
MAGMALGPPDRHTEDRGKAGLTPEAAAVAPLLAARALRDFGDGFAAVLLPVYLLGIGLSPWQVGVISSAALFGSSLLTLAIGILGAHHDRRSRRAMLRDELVELAPPMGSQSTLRRLSG